MPTSERLPVAEGVRLHALVWPGGTALPFLLVHGLSSNCRTWEAVGDLLHRRGHPVAAVDLRGHGRSDKPNDGYDFATLTADLLAVMRALGYTNPVVVGQSTGGNVALELALAAPDRLAGTVGIDGGVIELVDQWPTWEECSARMSPPPIAGMPVSDFEDVVRRQHPDWSDAGVAATLANCEMLPDGTVRPWLTLDRHLRILRALWEHRPSVRLAQLAVPLMLVLADSGDSWAATKRREAERAAALTPRLRVAWFEPGDHDLHVQQPGAVADLLAEAVIDGSLGP